MGLPEPPDDLDEFLTDQDKNEIEDKLDTLSKKDLLEFVERRGSVPVGDSDGRFLISCPARTRAICGIYPIPDPNGGGMKHVCTGPVVEEAVNNSFTNREKVYLSYPAKDDCAYNPDRFGDDDSDSNSSGWL